MAARSARPTSPTPPRSASESESSRPAPAVASRFLGIALLRAQVGEDAAHLRERLAGVGADLLGEGVAGCFHTEFRNGTYFEWLTCGRSKSALWAAKLAVACLLVVALAAVNHVGLLVFFLAENPGAGILRMSAAYWLLVRVLIASVALLCALLPLAANLLVITRRRYLH
ncbi:ABC transporter permease [Bounagaea algeriensis]